MYIYFVNKPVFRRIYKQEWTEKHLFCPTKFYFFTNRKLQQINHWVKQTIVFQTKGQQETMMFLVFAEGAIVTKRLLVIPASSSSHSILVLRRKPLLATLTFNNPEKEPRPLLKGSGRKLESFCDEGAAPLKKPWAKEELTNGQWRGAVLDAGVLSAGVASGVEEENSGVYWRVPPPPRVTWFFYITSRPYPTHDTPHVPLTPSTRKLKLGTTPSDRCSVSVPRTGIVIL